MQFKEKRERTSGPISAFTLVELIVVITILAVLATVGFLSLSGYSDDARSATVASNVRTVYSAILTESTTSGNSPRWYVEHDNAAALTGGAVVFVDGNPVALTGGNFGDANTNYSAGNPRWDRLRMNGDKFRLARTGDCGTAGTPASGSCAIAKSPEGAGSGPFPGFPLAALLPESGVSPSSAGLFAGPDSRSVGLFPIADSPLAALLPDSASAAYSTGVISIGAFDAMGKATLTGKSKPVSYFQVVGVSPSTKKASVTGNYMAAGTGAVLGLVDDPSSTSSTGAIVDSAVVNGGWSTTLTWTTCNAIKIANPSAASGTYSIDPDGSGPNAPFNAYCDMLTNGGGWTMVFSATDGTRFHVNSDLWTDINSPSYALAIAKRWQISALSTSTMVLYGANKIVWPSNKVPFTSTTVQEEFCGTTSSDSWDGATIKCVGWATDKTGGGGSFGVTNSAGFDHHSAGFAAASQYLELNSSCVNHYVYEYLTGGGTGYKNGGCNYTTANATRLSYFMK